MIDRVKLRHLALFLLASCAAAPVLAAPPSAPAADEIDPAALDRMLAGESNLQGAALERAIAAADAHPLGSRGNPVRAAMPQGQRAYLARLRCDDGARPRFERDGNLGPGVYGNIIDAYNVTCRGAEPVTVVMDMYHPRHVEDRPVPGFTIEAD